MEVAIMSAKRIAMSLGYGIIGAGGFMLLTADYMDATYGPTFQQHGLLPFFNWAFICVFVGLCAFVLGLCGRLPGTK
jgi:hypothetical protein